MYFFIISNDELLLALAFHDMLVCGSFTDYHLLLKFQKKIDMKSLQTNLKVLRPYPFCHTKCQPWVLVGGWLKIYLLFCFVWQSGSKVISKNIINKNKKLQLVHICFPFHHSTSTRRVFKLCLCNQSAEKESLPIHTFVVHHM